MLASCLIFTSVPVYGLDDILDVPGKDKITTEQDIATNSNSTPSTEETSQKQTSEETTSSAASSTSTETIETSSTEITSDETTSTTSETSSESTTEESTEEVKDPEFNGPLVLTGFDGTISWEENATDIPEDVTINLLRDGEKIDSTVTNAEMGWFYCFLDVVAQDTDGTPYSFSVEQEPATGFIAKYTDGETVSYTPKEGLFDIINVNNKNNIEGTVFWDKGERLPEQVMVKLLQNGEEYKTKEVTKDDNWKYVFENVPLYDKEGKEYSYSIAQEELEGFETQYTNSSKNGLSIKFNEKCETEGVEFDWIEVYYNVNGKTYCAGRWGGKDFAGKELLIPSRDFYLYFHSDDYEDKWYGLAIDSITEADCLDILGTVKNLPSGMTATELTGNNYPETNHKNYGNKKDLFWHYTSGETSDEPKEGFFNIENKDTRLEISSAIVWEGEGDKPDSITVDLLRNGEVIESVETTEAKNWEYRFSGLPRADKDGNQYSYSVQQQELWGWDTTYTKEATNGLRITFDPRCMAEGTSDYCQLYYKKDGTVYYMGQFYPKNVAGKYIEVPTNDFYLYFYSDSSIDNYYGISITDIKAVEPPTVQSTVSKLPSASIIELTGDNYPETEHNPYGNRRRLLWHYTGPIPSSTIPEEGLYDIKNKSLAHDIKGSIMWEGKDNMAYPKEVTVDLYRNNEYLKSTTTDASKQWKYTFEGIYDESPDGEAYTYHVEQKYNDNLEAFNTQYADLEGKGLEIKFNEKSYTPNGYYDYLYIYYKKDGKTYRLGEYCESSLSGLTVKVPSTDFYLQWVTSSNSNSKDEYGFSIDSIKEIYYDKIDGYNYDVPNMEIIELEGNNYPESEHNPYEKGVNKIWHYSARGEVTNTPKDNFFTIINTSFAIDLNGLVIWEGNQNATKPNELTIKLFRNGEYLRSVTTNASNNWEYCFDNVLPYDKEGNDYEYSVEQENIKGFSTRYTNKQGNGLKITFNSKTGTASSSDYFEIYYQKDGAFYKLDRYSSLGDKSLYVPTNDFYLYWKTGKFKPDAQNPDKTFYGFKVDEITSTVYDDIKGAYSKIPNVTPVEVTDNNYPESEHDNYEANAKKMWHYTFSSEESKTPKKGLINVINTSNTIQITDTVTWKGDENASKPDSVTINLLRNGEIYKTTTTSKSNNWVYTFDDVEPYDENGNEYTYTVEQEAINNFNTVYANKTGGLAITFSKNCKTPHNQGGISIYYEKNGRSYLAGSYKPNEIAGLTVKVPTKDFYLTWNSGIEFNGKEYGFMIDSIEDINYNSITGTQNNLPSGNPSEISGNIYPKSSDTTNNSKESSYWHYTKDLKTSNVPKKNFFNIINTSLTISIKSQIDWINTKETKYPQNVTINLFRNDELVETTTTSASENWIYLFNNLPQYDENGEEYKYSVEEEPLDGFITTYKNKENGLAITFSEKCEVESKDTDYISVYYKKDGRTYRVGEWGSVELAGKTIYIPSNDFYITLTTNEENDNYYGFEIESIKDIIYDSLVGSRIDLPEGFEEIEVSGNNYPETSHNGYGNNVNKIWHYSSKVITKDNKANGFYKITNTLDSHDIENYIRWEDEGNEDKRPESVTVTLTQNGEVYDKVVTNAENNWRYSFEDPPNRDKNGELYSYVISQDEEISDYHTKYVKQIKNKTNGTIIKFENNGYINGGDYVEIYYRYNSKLYKTDQYRYNDLRDEEIKIPSNDFYLYWHTNESRSDYYGFKVEYVNHADIDYNYGSVTDSLPNFEVITLTGDNYPESEHDPYGDNIDKLWHYIVGGEEYSETPSEEYDGIINTYQYQPIGGTVTWRDIKEVEHEEVIINLFQDGELFGTTTTNAEKEWKYSFDNVPMKKADGSDYIYTVETEPVQNYTTYYTGSKENKGLRIRFNDNFPKNAIDNMKSSDKSNFISIYYRKDGQIYKKGSYQYLGGLIIDVPSTDIYIAWDTKGAEADFYKNSIVSMEVIDITRFERDEISKLPEYDYNAEVTGTDYPRAGDAGYDSNSQVLWHYTFGETTPNDRAFDIVNIYNYVDVSGHKSWVDNEDYEEENEYLANSPIGYFLSKVFPDYTKSRNIPENLTITLYKDGQRYASQIISAKTDWNYNFGELPLYHEDGTKVSYKIQEEATRKYKSVYRNDLGYSSLNPGDNYFGIYNQQVKNVRVNFISEIEGADIKDSNISDINSLTNETRSPEESFENIDLNKDTIYGFRLSLEGMSYPSLIPNQEIEWTPGEGETENDRPKREKQEDEYIYHEFGNSYFLKKEAPVSGTPNMESTSNKYNGVLPGQVGVTDSEKEKLVIANLKPGIYKITEEDDVFFNYISMEALNSVEGVYFIKDTENNANYLVVTSSIYEHKELTIKVKNKVEPNKYYEGKELKNNKFITISGNTVSVEDLKNWGMIPDYGDEEETEYKLNRIEGSNSNRSYFTID